MPSLVETLRKIGLTDAEILNGRRYVVYQATLSAPPTVLVLDKPITDADVKKHGTEIKAKVEALRKVAKDAGVAKMDGARQKAVLDAVVLAKPAEVDVVEQKDWEPDPIKVDPAPEDPKEDQKEDPKEDPKPAEDLAAADSLKSLIKPLDSTSQEPSK